MTTGKTIALTIWTFVDKVMSLRFNMLSKFVITFLPRSMHLLISSLQSLSAVVLELIKSVTVSTFSSSISHDVIGLDTMIFASQKWSPQSLLRAAMGRVLAGSPLRAKQHGPSPVRWGTPPLQGKPCLSGGRPLGKAFRQGTPRESLGASESFRMRSQSGSTFSQNSEPGF